MLIYCGSRERTIDDWAVLLGKADPSFKIEAYRAASGQPNTIVVVRWDPEL